jgi:hypothetical protein
MDLWVYSRNLAQPFMAGYLVRVHTIPGAFVFHGHAVNYAVGPAASNFAGGLLRLFTTYATWHLVTIPQR